MDKAEVVFEKLAGAKWEAVKAFTKGLFGVGKPEMKATSKFIKTKAPYEGVIKQTTPRIEKINKMYGSQPLREMQMSRELNTYGKPGVAKAWTTEDRVKGLAKEKMLRELGL